MVTPWAAHAAFQTAHIFSELVTQPIGAELKPRGIALAQRALYRDPLILPDVATVIDLLIRGMIDDDLANGLLRNHGISLWPLKPGERDGEYYRSAVQAWRKAVALHKEIPGVRDYVDWCMRGFIKPGAATRAIVRAGGAPDYWLPMLDAMRERPSTGDVLGALVEERIRSDQAAPYMLAAGSHIDLWTLPRKWMIRSPGVVGAIEMRRRGKIDDRQWREFLSWERQTWDGRDSAWDDMLKALPGVADLVTMGLRESFNPELAQVYNNYGEFPELIRPWFAKLGLDYPLGFPIIADGVQRNATMADLYWAMHWHAMPLGSAYLAYQRFQPDLLRRFQEDNPNLKPFGIDDLKLHMKWADLPPGVRDWMLALSHPVLGQRQIQQGAQYAGWDRAEMQARFRLLGYTTNDAATLARIAEERNAARETAWIVALETAARKKTVSEIEGMYNEGIIDRATALRHLSDAGLPEALSTQLLDLSDAARTRSLLRAAVTATGRDYLAGVLSTAETADALGSLGIGSARVGELMQIWTVRRSRHRRQADTGRILKWLGQGRISVADARQRLHNLQWTDPDMVLMIAEAESTLQKLRAKEEKAAQSAVDKRARELAKLARAAQAEHQRLVAAANRVAPRAVLMQWLRGGEIDEQTFRDLLKARDYPSEDIDRYVALALAPRSRKATVVRGRGPGRPPGKQRQLSGADLRKAYLVETIDRSEYHDRLAELGYSESDIAIIIRDADLSHGAKGTTESPPAPPPTPSTGP